MDISENRRLHRNKVTTSEPPEHVVTRQKLISLGYGIEKRRIMERMSQFA